MTDKEKYIQLCDNETSIPIFSMPWWLDAVCGRDNWDSVIHEKGGKVIAAWPFVLKSRFGMRTIGCP